MLQSEFLTPPINYSPLEHVETPYQRAKGEWDNRLGRSVVQAKNWRAAFFSLAVIATALLVLNTYQLLENKVVPYIIEVNTDTGESRSLGRVAERGYQPKEEVIKYFLGKFVTDIRSVPSDPVVIKRNWLNAYFFLKREAANLLNGLTNDDGESPLKRIGQETVTVKPISIVKVDASDSYQVRWKEARYTKNGAPIEEYTMTGIFTLKLEKPKDEEALSINPLGIFISNFQWNREL